VDVFYERGLLLIKIFLKIFHKLLDKINKLLYNMLKELIHSLKIVRFYLVEFRKELGGC